VSVSNGRFITPPDLLNTSLQRDVFLRAQKSPSWIIELSEGLIHFRSFQVSSKFFILHNPFLSWTSPGFPPFFFLRGFFLVVSTPRRNSGNYFSARFFLSCSSLPPVGRIPLAPSLPASSPRTFPWAGPAISLSFFALELPFFLIDFLFVDHVANAHPLRSSGPFFPLSDRRPKDCVLPPLRAGVPPNNVSNCLISLSRAPLVI